MARPRKNGMDYFPHDTDAVGDEKIDAFRAIHGNDGYAFYFILCERIYRTPGAELDVSNPIIIPSLARKIMVTIERFHELLASALSLGLFSADAFDERGVLTSKGIQDRLGLVVDTRKKWREKKALIHKQQTDKQVISGDNGSFPSVIPSKALDIKDQELKTQDQNTKHDNAPAHEQFPEPFAIVGDKLDVWTALNHYRIRFSGFLTFEKIRTFQGHMHDELILAAIKESGGRSDSYCLKVLEDWNKKGWQKLDDHPKYRPTPTEVGDVVAIFGGRNQSQRLDRRNTTSAAFEEARKRSKPGKQVFTPRE